MESKRMIAVSLAKLQGFRTQRGGMRLHRGLLVSYVLRNAKQAYLGEKYRQLCEYQQYQQQQQQEKEQQQQEQQQQRPYKVYLIGSEAMASALEEAGIPFVGGPGPEVDLGWPPEKPELDPDVRAVLLGFDRHFSYAKMVRAVAYLRDPACAFVATNTDTCLPLEGDRVIPGTGSLLAALECASQRKAAIVGKPSEFMFECVLRAEKVARERCLMVGDRLDTDILMGTQCGLPTLLVLTGVSTLAEAQACRDSSDHERHQLAPTYVIDSIADLLPAIDEL